MVSGKHISGTEKLRIYKLHFSQQKSALEIWTEVFDANPNVIQYETIRRFCVSLDSWDTQEVNSWLYGHTAADLGGRPRKVTPLMPDALLDMTRRQRKQSVNSYGS